MARANYQYKRTPGRWGTGPLPQYKRQKRQIVDSRGYVRPLSIQRVPRQFGNQRSFQAKMVFAKNMTIDLVVSSATPVQQLVRANGIVSPILSAGERPNLFAQYMALYSTFFVKSSKITCTFCNESDNNRVMVGIDVVCDSPSVGSDLGTCLEQQNISCYALDKGSDHASTVLSRKYDSARFFQTLITALAGMTTQQGTSSADPSEVANFRIFAVSLGGSTLADCTVHAIVRVEYEVMFTDPLQVASS